MVRRCSTVSFAPHSWCLLFCQPYISKEAVSSEWWFPSSQLVNDNLVSPVEVAWQWFWSSTASNSMRLYGGTSLSSVLATSSRSSFWWRLLVAALADVKSMGTSSWGSLSASKSASSFPAIPLCPGIHWKFIAGMSFLSASCKSVRHLLFRGVLYWFPGPVDRIVFVRTLVYCVTWLQPNKRGS